MRKKILRRCFLIAAICLVAALAYLVFSVYEGIRYAQRIHTLSRAEGVLYSVGEYYQKNHHLPRLNEPLGPQLPPGGNIPIDAQGNFLDGYGHPFEVFVSGHWIGIASRGESPIFFLDLQNQRLDFADDSGRPPASLDSK
jgi:hypothetical protein